MQAIGIETRRYPGGTACHRHDHHQIVLPLGGRMEMEACGRAARLDAAQFAALAAGVEHAFEAPEGDAFLVIDLPAHDTAPVWSRARACPFVPLDPALRGFAAVLAEALAEARTAAADLPGTGASDPAVAGLLLDAVARRIGAVPPLPSSLARAMAAMRADLAAPHRIGPLARAAGTSESRLHAAFRDHLGTTPMGWLGQRRMDEALRLLRATRLAVGEVAARVGYADAAAFARAFRRAHGRAPSELRAAQPGRVWQDRHETR